MTEAPAVVADGLGSVVRMSDDAAQGGSETTQAAAPAAHGSRAPLPGWVWMGIGLAAGPILLIVGLATSSAEGRGRTLDAVAELTGGRTKDGAPPLSAEEKGAIDAVITCVAEGRDARQLLGPEKARFLDVSAWTLDEIDSLGSLAVLLDLARTEQALRDELAKTLGGEATPATAGTVPDVDLIERGLDGIVQDMTRRRWGAARDALHALVLRSRAHK